MARLGAYFQQHMMPSEAEKSGASEQEVGPANGQVPPRSLEGVNRRGLADAFQQIYAITHRVRNLARRFAATVRIWGTHSATAVATAVRTTTRRAHAQMVLFPLRARFHFRQQRTLYVRLGTSFVVLVTLFACWDGIALWPNATRYCTRLSPSVFEQVAVALGASVSGLLAIVFALTTFAIQQVAAREAAEVVLEYAGDRRMASTYWILAAIATICFALPFVRLPQDFLPTELVSFGVLLILTFLLIYRHFKIVMLYSDPRFTVDRLHQRGMRELRTVARTVNCVKRAMHNTESETHESK